MNSTYVSKILWYESIGFLLIIALSWIDELSDLPFFMGGKQYIPNSRESALETVIVLLVAAPVMIITRKMVSRLFHLEGFLRVCACCKKLEHNAEWIPIAEFFERNFRTGTSHAICLACMEEAKKTIEHSAAAKTFSRLMSEGLLLG